jgi:hypothetical protein
MVKIFLTILFFIFLFLWGNRTFAAGYIGAGYGSSNYVSPKLTPYEVWPHGTSYIVQLGQRTNYLELEGFFAKSSHENKIIHENVEYKMKQSLLSYGAVGKFNLRYLYIKLGYAFHSMSQKAFLGTAEVNNTAMNSIYGLDENPKDEGLVLGGGLSFKLGKSWRFYLDYTRYNLSKSDAHANAIYAGLSFSFNNFNLFKINPNNFYN